MNLKDRHLLTLMDYTKEEIIYLLDLAKKALDKLLYFTKNKADMFNFVIKLTEK